MKIITNSKDLTEALNNIYPIINNNKHSESILTFVKIIAFNNRVSFYVTDLNIFAKHQISACVFGRIVFIVQISSLFSIIRKINVNSKITFIFKSYHNSGKMVLQSISSQFAIPYISAKHFPNFEEHRHTCEFSILSKKLCYLLKTVKHAISIDENKNNLNGILLHFGNNIIRAVSTDSYRIAITEFSLSLNIVLYDILIPRRTVVETIRILNSYNGWVLISISRNRITLKIGKTTIVSKLIENKFPDYNKVIPWGNNKTLRVNKMSFINNINIVSSITDEKSRSIRLEIKRNIIIIYAVNNRSGLTANIITEVEYNNINLDVLLDSKYLLDALLNITSNEVFIKLESANSSILIIDAKIKGRYSVLMPMQL